MCQEYCFSDKYFQVGMSCSLVYMVFFLWWHLTSDHQRGCSAVAFLFTWRYYLLSRCEKLTNSLAHMQLQHVRLSKETGQKRGREPSRAKKARGRLGRQKRRKVRCPRGIAPACGSKLLFGLWTDRDAIVSQKCVAKRTFRSFVVAERSLMAAVFNQSQNFACLENFRNEKTFENFFDARVLVRECFRLSSRVRLCSLKFQRARLSPLCQILACSRALPGNLIPTCFQRARSSALGQILSCWRAVSWNADS